MAGRLDGKVALVTGGGSGIGRACAVRFAREGANVCVADIDLAAAADTARQVDAAGRKSVSVQVDTTDEAANDAMVRRCVDGSGRWTSSSPRPASAPCACRERRRTSRTLC
jgi:NAD(P)-dependent dehydrogenase (short-subunit alcohol dehydrogenase family)